MGKNEKLVQGLKEMGIQNSEVLDAMRKVSMEEFSPSELIKTLRSFVSPFTINTGEIETISHPFLVALMTDLLQVEKGTKVLEIGTGIGYQSAVLSFLGANVYTVERIYYLYLEAKKKFDKLNLPVQAFYKDGRNGLREHAPFDRIIYTVAMPYLPENIERQMNKENGILIVPIGNDYEPQRLYRILYKGGEKTVEKGIYTNFSSVQDGTTIKGPGGFVFSPEENEKEMFYI